MLSPKNPFVPTPLCPVKLGFKLLDSCWLYSCHHLLTALIATLCTDWVSADKCNLSTVAHRSPRTLVQTDHRLYIAEYKNSLKSDDSIVSLYLTSIKMGLCCQLRYAERCNSLNSCRKVYGWPCGGHIRDSLTKEATSNGTAVPCPITALRRKVPDRRGVELTVLLFQYSFCSFSQQEG